MGAITDYTKILPAGSKNAISSDDLVLIMGFESTRALQSDISKSRNAGQVILSSTQGGYYLPANDEEIEEFIKVLQSRAINTFRALRSAREALKHNDNQMELADLEVFDNEL